MSWLIPWVLLFVSIGFSIGILGISVQAIIKGILIVGAAVLGNQLLKQTTEAFKGSQLEAAKEIKLDEQVTEIK